MFSFISRNLSLCLNNIIIYLTSLKRILDQPNYIKAYFSFINLVGLHYGYINSSSKCNCCKVVLRSKGLINRNRLICNCETCETLAARARPRLAESRLGSRDLEEKRRYINVSVLTH